MTAETIPDQTRGTETILEVDGLGHSFGDLEVLGDVSFTVSDGTVTCLVGPNGSGKTTILRILAGILDHDQGTVEIPTESDRDVGYLAQQPAFRPQFTVRETLSFYASLVDIDVDVDAIIDQVGLAAVADRRVRGLSGGMVRLLGVAQATIGDPPLLVLDEPSSGLDPTMTRHITDIVDDLAASGDAVLLATHDLVSVERIGDEVLVLDRGGIVAHGSPESLRRDTGAETLEAAVSELTREGDTIGVWAGGESE